jgi:hypothetical protein
VSVVVLIGIAQRVWSVSQFRRRAALISQALAEAAAAAATASSGSSGDSSSPPSLQPPADPALPKNPKLLACTCVVCLSQRLRRSPGSMSVDGGIAFPCGHRLCEACLWRFGAPSASSNLGWFLKDGSHTCPICKPVHRSFKNDSKEPLNLPKAPHEVLWSLRMRHLLASTGYPRGGRAFGKRGSTASITWSPISFGGDGGSAHGQPWPSSEPWMSDESRLLIAQHGPEVVHPGSVPELGPTFGTDWTLPQKKLAKDSIERWRDVRAHAEAEDKAAATFRRNGNYGRGWVHRTQNTQAGQGVSPESSSWANLPSGASFSGGRVDGSISSGIGSGRGGGGGSW